MRLRIQVRSGWWLEVDADNVKGAIDALQEFLEIFAEQQCGRCKAADVLPQCRQDKDGNRYYGLKCRACGAELSLGQKRVGDTLFIKRKDADGNVLPDGGWRVWQPKAQAASNQSYQDEQAF